MISFAERRKTLLGDLGHLRELVVGLPKQVNVELSYDYSTEPGCTDS